MLLERQQPQPRFGKHLGRIVAEAPLSRGRGLPGASAAAGGEPAWAALFLSRVNPHEQARFVSQRGSGLRSANESFQPLSRCRLSDRCRRLATIAPPPRCRARPSGTSLLPLCLRRLTGVRRGACAGLGRLLSGRERAKLECPLIFKLMSTASVGLQPELKGRGVWALPTKPARPPKSHSILNQVGLS